MTSVEVHAFFGRVCSEPRWALASVPIGHVSSHRRQSHNHDPSRKAIPRLEGDESSFVSAGDTERRHSPDAQEQVDVQQQREQQAQRLESLGELAGGVAHDFNNLLAVILNYASFVSEELVAATESDWSKRVESAVSDIEQITLAAQRAANLTRQLLAFARREVIRPEVLDLNHVISGVEEMLRRTIGEHVELLTTLADDLWPILADRDSWNKCSLISRSTHGTPCRAAVR